MPARAALDVITPADLKNERLLVPARKSLPRLALDRAFSSACDAIAGTIETSMLDCCLFSASGMGVGIVDRIGIGGGVPT